MRAFRPWLLVAALLGMSAPCAAQGGEAGTSSASPAAGVSTEAPLHDDDVEAGFGEETPELRALRLAELELFGRDEPLLELGPVTAGPLPGLAPALSSDAPPVVVTADADAPSRDLSWLVGLSLPNLPVRWDDRVVRYLEFFRDDPRGRDLVRAWMGRRERWGAMIRETLRSAGLPNDLLYVAMIESGFRADARSDAGAVGPWQFVSGTGAEYGLTQNHWVDERRDPVRSTEAAARYLSALHDRFGTWELALAAYNMGYGALLRSIRKYDTNDYWELVHLEAALPFETTLYVGKIMACAVVGRNLERFGLGELAVEPAEAWDVVRVPGGASLSTVARAAGVSVADLRALNPALLRDRVPPGEADYALRIPPGTADAFASRWARARPRAEAHVAYTVRFGERLADVARRYRTTERELRTLNELADADDVDAGFSLMVPAVAPRDDAPESPPVVSVHTGALAYPGRRRVFYRCHRGDAIREIAAFFRVPVEDVATWNALDPHAALQDGMFLQLFVPPEVDLARAVVLTPEEVRVLVVGSDEFFAHHLASEGRVRVRYRVREGDTLGGIGARFGIPVGSLCRINLIGRDAVLRIGQEVIVYAQPERVPASLRAELGLPLLAASEAAEGGAAEAPEGVAAESPEGVAAESPEGVAAEAPEGVAAEAAEGGAAEAAEGGAAEAPEGGAARAEP